MTYDEGWEKAKLWCRYYYYKKWDRPKKIEFEDYFQECALCYYGKLKPQFTPYQCWCYSKVAFERILIKFVYRTKNAKLKIVSLNQIDKLKNEEFDWDIDKFSVNLTDSEKKVAELIIDGYETKEIYQILNLKQSSIYTMVKHIKRKYAEFLGLENWQRKHLRNFTRNRTAKEIENWDNCKKRVAKIQQERHQEKLLRLQNKG